MPLARSPGEKKNIRIRECQNAFTLDPALSGQGQINSTQLQVKIKPFPEYLNKHLNFSSFTCPKLLT